MLIDIKFGIGDRVKFKYPNKESQYEVCPCCGGEGIVVGVDGNRYECSECEGKGEIEASFVRVCKDYYNTIRDIRVDWKRGKTPKIEYRMDGFHWSYIWIDEEDIELITS